MKQARSWPRMDCPNTETSWSIPLILLPNDGSGVKPTSLRRPAGRLSGMYELFNVSGTAPNRIDSAARSFEVVSSDSPKSITRKGAFNEYAEKECGIQRQSDTL